MRRIFKKKHIVIMAVLTAVTAQVNASDYRQSYYCVPEDCCQKTCELDFTAELLYWRPELCGLESAFGNTTITTSVDANAVTTTTVIESHKEPSFEWNTGFRLGAGTSMNNFDIQLNWTHYNGDANYKDHNQHGHWNFKYDQIDLLLGRIISMSSCFDLKPFIGIRGIKIDQKLKSHLETTFSSTLIGNSTVTTEINDKEEFWGVGPEIGIEANWDLGCNFSLYGSLAAVTYYGDVDGKSFHQDTFTSTESVCNGKKHGCFNTFGTDLAIGIRWECTPSCFCGCDIDLMLNLGLEQHRIYDFSDLGSDGNLSLDGGVLGAGIGYRF